VTIRQYGLYYFVHNRRYGTNAGVVIDQILSNLYAYVW
jgi:hypothetical protein